MDPKRLAIQIEYETILTQKTFRVLLQAMSHPGRVYQLDYEVGSWHFEKYNLPSEFGSLFSVLLTLLDFEVSFCVIGKERKYLETVISELTGSHVKDILDADIIIISDGESNGEIYKAKRGSLVYPEGGATVIYVVEALDDSDNGKPVALLKGPGIMNCSKPVIHGIGKNEFFYIKEINSEYPLGIDCIFVDRMYKIMCVPRSTRIEVK